MSKKSFLIFAVGAVAGWTAAQRLAGEAESWPKASSDAIDNEASTPPASWDSRPESPVTRPITGGGDPFRGAFAESLAEVELDANELPDSDTEVA